MKLHAPHRTLTTTAALMLGLLLASLFVFSACTALKDMAAKSGETICSARNAASRLISCETPIPK